MIKGERKLEREELEEEAYLRKEFLFKKFNRTFALPVEIEPEKVSARFRDGILEITLVKKEEAKKNTYKVTVQG